MLQSKLKRALLYSSLFILLLYIPLAITVYTSSWYEFNYNLQDTYDNLDENDAKNATDNLIGFFMHRNDMNDLWNDKEKAHMSDVRNIYDILFILAVLSVIVIVTLKEREVFLKSSRINIIVKLSLLIILPFFAFFWNNIFHTVMFSNDFWINTPLDISYHLFPIEFFERSLLFIALFSVLENIVIYFLIKSNSVNIILFHKES